MLVDQCRQIENIYEKLFSHFGPLHWWPGDSPFEVMVGAVLTQAVSWNNAARAVNNLKAAELLSVEGMLAIPRTELAELIRPALYHGQKARKLQELMGFISGHYEGSLEKMFRAEFETLRTQLLSVWGIGPETADSILLYAGEYPVFVVDAYTIRIFSRIGLISEKTKYREMQLFLHNNCRKEVYFYNEYHALLVNLGKDFCRKNKPLCQSCPISTACGLGIQNM